MLSEVKLSLRISHTALDTDLLELIEEARADLMLSGISHAKANDDTDPLIKRAIKTYVKAGYVADSKDAERFQTAYDLLKNHLSISHEYSAYTITFYITDGVNPLADTVVNFNDTEMIANANGHAVFIGLRKSQNMPYVVKLDGYTDVEGTVDVEQSAQITITMAVSS